MLPPRKAFTLALPTVPGDLRSSKSLPHSWRLDDRYSRHVSQQHLAAGYDLLRLQTQFGHEVLRDLALHATDEMDATVVLLLRQHLEYLDATDVLLRHVQIVPALVQTRTTLEAALQLGYVVRKRDVCIAAAYSVAQIRREEPTLTEMADDVNMPEEVREWAQGLLTRLNQECRSSYPRRKADDALSGLKRFEPWYRVFGGPRNLRELAAQAGLEPIYRLAYPRLSAAVHAAHSMHGLRLGPDPDPREEDVWVAPLRSLHPNWGDAIYLGSLAAMAARVSLLAYSSHLRSRAWYARFLDQERRFWECCEKSGITQFAPALALRAILELLVQQAMREADPATPPDEAL